MNRTPVNRGELVDAPVGFAVAKRHNLTPRHFIADSLHESAGKESRRDVVS